MDKEGLIKKAKKIKWEYWVDRHYGPFSITQNFLGMNKEYSKAAGFFGSGCEAILYQHPFIYNSENSSKSSAEFLKKYFKNKTIFDISKKLSGIHEKNKKKISSIIKNKTLAPVEKMIMAREVIRSYGAFLWITVPLEKYYNKKIADVVEKYVKKDIQKFIGDASFPVKPNEYGKMLKMLESGVEIDLVQKRFFWMKSRDGFTDFYTIKELKEIKKNIRKPEKHKVVIPKPLKRLFLEVKELTFLRTDRTDKYYESFALIRPILKEAANYIGVSFKDLESYDIDSIIAGHPQKYNKDFCYLFIGKDQIIQNKKINPYLDKIKDAGLVKGSVAFAGRIKGIVRVIKHPSEMGKISQGDILVSQMTFPSFISAMQKAAAFVTDEGGLTCHAAIVAREMKKPCIIGTKNATRILKDGDLVDVDANKGIVKIIKKFNGKQANL